MSQQHSVDQHRLGFLHVTEVPSVGSVGGLLVTNLLGRPLEFQCTTPVRPNRTQEILYGPTLRSVVFADLIGKTLVERVQLKPSLILIDQPELLEVRKHQSCPVICLVTPNSRPHDVVTQHESSQSPWGPWQPGGHPDFPQDVDQAGEMVRLVPQSADLHEPLQRVAEALQETLRTGAVA